MGTLLGLMRSFDLPLAVVLQAACLVLDNPSQGGDAGGVSAWAVHTHQQLDEQHENNGVQQNAHLSWQALWRCNTTRQRPGDLVGHGVGDKEKGDEGDNHTPWHFNIYLESFLEATSLQSWDIVLLLVVILLVVILLVVILLVVILLVVTLVG